jgi:hypothetical protein
MGAIEKAAVSSFHIVAQYQLQEFSQTVERFIDGGWELHGQPFVFEGTVCQALIRKTIKKENQNGCESF